MRATKFYSHTKKRAKSLNFWIAKWKTKMDAARNVKKLTEWEPGLSRPVGRPRMRWLEQVEEDL
jgi:hypothetical protein